MNEPKVNQMPEESISEENERLVKDMNQKISKMMKEPQNIVEFWEDTMEIIKNAMISIQTAKTAVKILRIWCAGINKAEENFGMPLSQKANEIFDDAKKLLNMPNIEESEEAWNKVFSNMVILEKITKKLLEDINNKTHENPLLTLPAIRGAAPLRKEMLKISHPNSIYLSAVKLIVLKNDKISPENADKAAAKLLYDMGCNRKTIEHALLASPMISHLPIKEKNQVIQKEIFGSLQSHDVER